MTKPGAIPPGHADTQRTPSLTRGCDGEPRTEPVDERLADAADRWHAAADLAGHASFMGTADPVRREILDAALELAAQATAEVRVVRRSHLRVVA